MVHAQVEKDFDNKMVQDNEYIEDQFHDLYEACVRVPTHISRVSTNSPGIHTTEDRDSIWEQ